MQQREERFSANLPLNHMVETASLKRLTNGSGQSGEGLRALENKSKETVKMGNYSMRCLGTGETFEDDYTLHFTDGALVIADYKSKLEVKSNLEGMEVSRLVANFKTNIRCGRYRNLQSRSIGSRTRID